MTETLSWKLRPEAKALWLKALRSGEYKQGTNALEKQNGDVVQHCCLGVLCRVAMKAGVEMSTYYDSGNYHRTQFDGDGAFLPAAVARWARADGSAIDNDFRVTYNGEPRDLSWLNDDRHLSFGQIANLIEEQL